MGRQKHVLPWAVCLGFVLFLTSVAVAADPAAEEKAIRAASKTFVEAFNRRDAKAVAAMWTKDGDYMDETGRVYRGRAAIEREFKDYFAQSKGRTIRVYIDSIRFVKPDVAIIDGMTEVSPAPKGKPGNGRYTVVRVKQGRNWLIASVRETSQDVPSNYEHLKQLEWVIGEWVDEAGESAVHTTAAWSKNKNFIVRTFTVKIGDRPVVSGTQRIGWDPQRKQIKSWLFDSAGGVGEGLWVRHGDKWVIRATAVLQDGAEASATHVITMIDDDAFTWKSINRVVGGEAEDDVEEVKVVRLPPKPM